MRKLKGDSRDLFYIARSASGKLGLYVVPSASNLECTKVKDENGLSWYSYKIGSKKNRTLRYHKSLSPLGTIEGEQKRFVKSLPEGTDMEVIESASMYLRSIGQIGYVIWWEKVLTRWNRTELAEYMQSIGY